MTRAVDSLTLWLADYYLLSMVLLAVVVVTTAAMKQPVHRLTVIKSTFAGLFLLGILCSLPNWSRVHLMATDREEKPAAAQAIGETSPPAVVESETFERREPIPVAPATATAGAPEVVKNTWRRPQVNWRTALTVAFVGGAVLVVTWLSYGGVAAHRLRRSATPAPLDIAKLLADVAAKSGSNHGDVELLTSDCIDVAVALGIWRPAVLLPRDWIETQSRDQLHSVLAHEWSHVVNHDVQWLAASRALLVILWAQPLFWLLRRRMRLDQEALADAAAAELTSRQRYAEQLVAWARAVGSRPSMRVASAVGFWEGPSQLRQRIALLINEQFTVVRNCPRGWRRGAAFAAVLSSLLLSFVTLKPSPPSAVAEEASSVESPPNEDKATPVAPRFAKRSVPIEGDFVEGWKQTVVLPESEFGSGGRAKLTVEQGWLCVRRETSDDQLEWQIVLCRVEEGVMPEIGVMEGMPSYLNVSYREGRYFVRESMNLLRAMRESASGGTLLAKKLLGPAAKNSGWGTNRSPTYSDEKIVCSGWREGDWFFVTTGPDVESWRAVVRLDSTETSQSNGVSTTVTGHVRYYHGAKWLIDDGELLMADRTTLPMYEVMKKEKAAREAILAGRLPAIDAAAWLNTEDAPTWETLNGRVVLVDFWGTWCGPCVAKLPDTQKLHEKFADRGLTVIGIHSQQDADTCAAFVNEQGYTFPVALDSGKTAEAFGISAWPAYFLIDRNGKVVEGFKNRPPSEETVAAVLEGRAPHQSVDQSGGPGGPAAVPSDEGAATDFPRSVRVIQAAQRVVAGEKRPPALLSYGDGKPDGKKSYGGSGHMIRFDLPEGVTRIRGIRIHSSRYGLPEAPKEDFEITFLSEDGDETLHSEAAPYHLFKRGKENWVRVMFDKEVELPKKFWVALNFNPHQTKGVYLSYDTSTKGEYSRVGLSGDEDEPKETDFGGDWMVQVMLAKPEK